MTTPTTHPAAETSGERIELPGGWFLEHNGMSAPHRRYWINHPGKGALFHVDTRHCEHEFQEFAAALATKAAADGADQKLAVYRDVLSEITAKAVPLRYAEDDPDRITSYFVPCDPIHRAAELDAKVAALSHPAAPAPEPAVDHVELVRAYGDAQFQCGDWEQDEADAPYDAVLARSRAAHAALLARLAELEAEIKRLRDAEPTGLSEIERLLRVHTDALGEYLERNASSEDNEEAADLFRESNRTEQYLLDAIRKALASAGTGGVVVPDGEVMGAGVFWYRNAMEHWPVDGTKVCFIARMPPAQPEQNGTTEGK